MEAQHLCIHISTSTYTYIRTCTAGNTPPRLAENVREFVFVDISEFRLDRSYLQPHLLKSPFPYEGNEIPNIVATVVCVDDNTDPVLTSWYHGECKRLCGISSGVKIMLQGNGVGREERKYR
jgi:hypothetical protein